MARILLVEDDFMLVELYSELLKGEGYTVDSAKDGLDALEKASAGGYDLILLDVMLPKMDGIAMLQELAKNPPKQQNKRIILMTNLGQEQTFEKASEYGVSTHLVKSSLTPEQFLQQVKINLPQ